MLFQKSASVKSSLPALIASDRSILMKAFYNRKTNSLVKSKITKAIIKSHLETSRSVVHVTNSHRVVHVNEFKYTRRLSNQN